MLFEARRSVKGRLGTNVANVLGQQIGDCTNNRSEPQASLHSGTGKCS